MAETRQGGCLCGEVRYELDGPPFLVGSCHCADCRKESGSAFVFYAKWPIGAFRLSGDARSFAGRSFCPQCGSRLFNLHREEVEVRVGSLDEAPATIGPPMQEGWIRRREHWLRPVDDAIEDEEDPPL